jgi:hypothetical protein
LEEWKKRHQSSKKPANSQGSANPNPPDFNQSEQRASRFFKPQHWKAFVV